MNTAIEVQPARRRIIRPDCDVRVLVIVMILLGVGVSLVASSSSFFAGGVFSDQFALTRRHLVRVALAAGAMFIAMNIDYRWYRKTAPMLLVLGVALVAGLFLFGTEVRNTQRWFAVPVIGTTLQPSDLARLTLVIFLAWWIARCGRQLTEFRRGFVPAALAIVLVAGLIAATPNYGTACATVAVSLVMLFAGGARFWHLLAFAASGLGLALVRVLSEPYARARVMGFLNRGEDVQELNWQVHQSLIGLGSGGLFGVGVGESGQKLSWLPDAYTDFIFSILGEELGLAGTLAVSGLFLLLALRALKLSQRCSDSFGEMLVVGVGTTIFVYAMLNMFVATGLFPVTGLPLPLVSYGGSALLANALAIGILLNVSRCGLERSRRVGADA